MKPNINPCLGHDCYDPDTGCMMPGIDRWYACPLRTDPGPEDFEGWEKMIQDAKEPEKK